MPVHTSKTPGTKSQSVASSAVRKQSVGGSALGFVDNSPKTAAYRNLQELADKSSRMANPANAPGQGEHPLEQLESIAGTLVQDVKTRAEGKMLPVYIQAWGAIFNEFQPEVVKIARRVKGVPLLATLKESGTAKKKVAREYGGESNKLVDIGRATIMCKTKEQVIQAYEEVRRSFAIQRIKNRFKSPAGGYRDILINVKLSNGHIAEIQIHLEEIALVKEKEGHKLYEIIRAFGDKVAEGEALTPDEVTELNRVNLEMKELYDKAWERFKATPDK